MAAFSLTSGVKFCGDLVSKGDANGSTESGVTHLLAGEVDAHGTVPDQIDRDLVLVARHTADDNITDGEAGLEGPSLLVLDGMLLLPQARSTAESLHARHVDRVDLGAVVGQQGSQGSADNLGAVDDGDPAAVQPLAILENGVVDLQVLEDLDNGQRGAGQDGLLVVGGGV